MKKRFLKITNNIIRLSYTEEESFLDVSDFVETKMMMGTEISTSPSLVFSVELNERDVTKGVVEGEPIIKTTKTVDGQRTVIENLTFKFSHKAYKAKVALNIGTDEQIYGFGQDEDGVLNKRYGTTYLFQHNMIIPVPFFISSKGYGVLVDCSSLMKFNGDQDKAILTLECVKQVDLYVITGDVDTIISGYRQLTGKASKMPDWVFGFMQSKESYKDQWELLEVAKKHREAGVPLDVVIQDWETWEGDLWGEKKVDHSRYPNLAGLKESLHKMNLHSLISVWPNMNVGGDNHKEFAENDYLLNDYSTYNAFDGEARKLYYRQCEEGLSEGFDGWWCDNSEPFPIADWNCAVKKEQLERYRLVGATHNEYLGDKKANVYALYHAKTFWENEKYRPTVNLSRAGYAGIQKYGVILWAGDTSATWAELKREISKGISICLSGIPYWTVDSGGFFAGGAKSCLAWHGGVNKKVLWCWGGDYDDGIKDLGYQELYTRWLQFSVFLPVMRSHGTDTPREFYHFNGDFKEAIISAIKLRYLLSPYILQMAKRVHEDDYTMMRSLIFDYSHDKKSYEIDDQFMFGNDLLVCPVLEPMYYDVNSRKINSSRLRKCYLPKGNNWIDFYTHENYEGGKEVSVRCDITRIPLFVKEGSVIPVKEGLSYISEDKHLKYLKF